MVPTNTDVPFLSMIREKLLTGALYIALTVLTAKLILNIQGWLLRLLLNF
jgi:hypothetical protein